MADTPESRARKRNLQRDQVRGARAEALLKDPLLKEAIAKIKTFADQAWKDSTFDDIGQRERAYYLHRAVKDFEQNLKTVLQSGEMATRELVAWRELDQNSKRKGKR